MLGEILAKYCRLHTESIAIEIKGISFFEGGEGRCWAGDILVFRRGADA